MVLLLLWLLLQCSVDEVSRGTSRKIRCLEKVCAKRSGDSHFCCYSLSEFSRYVQALYEKSILPTS